MKKRFCVIGDKRCSSPPVTREFKSTASEAQGYAESLIRNQYMREGKPMTLLIVEVIGAVSTGLPKVDYVPVNRLPELE